ncbi:30344_t:CDS:2, partial [Gigaspora margarita]
MEDDQLGQLLDDFHQQYKSWHNQQQIGWNQPLHAPEEDQLDHKMELSRLLKEFLQLLNYKNQEWQ